MYVVFPACTLSSHLHVVGFTVNEVYLCLQTVRLSGFTVNIGYVPTVSFSGLNVKSCKCQLPFVC